MAKFLISLVDDGGLEGIVRNSSLEFVLKILPVNQAPGFVLSSTCVVIDEDSGLSGSLCGRARQRRNLCLLISGQKWEEFTNSTKSTTV